MLQHGDLKIVDVRPTLQLDGQRRSIAAFDIVFSVRGKGPYRHTMPAAGFTRMAAEQAVMPLAQEIADTLDIGNI